MDKYTKIKKVLIITMILNTLVAIIKLTIGILFKISMLVADGLHSLTDSINNVVGLIAVNFSKKRNDSKHPYGYEKYETIATLIIAVFIAILGYETLLMGINKVFQEPAQEQIPLIVYISIFATIIFNIVTVIYEGRNAKTLNSEFLKADANETKGDIFISLALIAGIFLMNVFQDLRLDGIFTIIISFFIFKNAYSVFKETTYILTDRNVIDEKIIYDIVMSHPKVKFCHAIRSRGKTDSVFIDFHLGVENIMSIEKAHDIVTHEVKLLLKGRIEGIKSIFIHIEPETAINRKNSIFKQTDY